MMRFLRHPDDVKLNNLHHNYLLGRPVPEGVHVFLQNEALAVSFGMNRSHPVWLRHKALQQGRRWWLATSEDGEHLIKTASLPISPFSMCCQNDIVAFKRRKLVRRGAQQRTGGACIPSQAIAGRMYSTKSGLQQEIRMFELVRGCYFWTIHQNPLDPDRLFLGERINIPKGELDFM
jgi:hypothetical protein